jgi:hypothetical protein
MPTPTYVSGLDLGQATDPSAFIIAACSTHPDPDPDRKGCTLNHYDVVHIHRWDLGTKYIRIVEDLKAWFMMKQGLPQSTLLVDATGGGTTDCGDAPCFRTAGIRRRLHHHGRVQRRRIQGWHRDVAQAPSMWLHPGPGAAKTGEIRGGFAAGRDP